VTVFTYTPIPTDFIYLFAGNTEYNDPSLDWNGNESSGINHDESVKTPYQFNYCLPLKSGDYFLLFNEYELYNGGNNGDLFCSKKPGWRPK
jgi:hypothetical protein